MTSKPKPKPAEPADPITSPPDPQEEDFWNTPGAPARTLHFTGELLTDEELDISDVDASLSSPLGPTPNLHRSARPSRAMQFTAKEAPSFTEESLSPERTAEHDTTIEAHPPDDDNDDNEDEEEEQTVILQKAPLVPEPDTPQETEASARPKTKFKVTTELERAVVCIDQ